MLLKPEHTELVATNGSLFEAVFESQISDPQ